MEINELSIQENIPLKIFKCVQFLISNSHKKFFIPFLFPSFFDSDIDHSANCMK